MTDYQRIKQEYDLTLPQHNRAAIEQLRQALSQVTAETGVGIASISQPTVSLEDGGANILVVTLTDGQQLSFSVRNGSVGPQGEPGPQGPPGNANANLDEVKATVAQAIAAIDIGGVNLLRKTNRGLGSWKMNTNDAQYTLTADGEGILLTVTQPCTGWAYLYYSLAEVLPLLEPNTRYIVSMDVKTNARVSSNIMLVRGNNTGRLTNSVWFTHTGDEQWQHVTAKLDTNDLSERDMDKQQVLYIGNLGKAVGYLQIKNLKLEKGNIATDWTAAPEDLQEDLDALVDRVWPVGSIYMSINSTDPGQLFGGTWERIKDTFLLAAGDSYQAGVSGGQAAVTLRETEMPKHTHGSVYTSSGADADKEYSWLAASPGTNLGYVSLYAGGGQPHDNMPPYLSVYMWRRVS